MIRNFTENLFLGFSLQLKRLQNQYFANLLAFINHTHYMLCREKTVNHARSFGSKGEWFIERAMTYTPQHIANYFLDKADEDCVPVSQLKLIKLIYIAYGWNLAINGSRLFEEPIYAWKHGPVIRSIYDEFKSFGKRQITSKSKDIDLDTWEPFEPRIPSKDDDVIWVLNKVWAVYKRFEAWTLREKTHEPNGPWDKVYNADNRDVKLIDAHIQEHYAERIRTYIAAAKEFA